MRALRLASYELRRFRGRLPLLGLAFLVIVPTLYGSLYLWSNWDPYGRLSDLPVAVVNEDRPVTVDGERVDAGRQFVGQLRARPQFDWRFTDEADARAGLRDGRYAFTIRVPSDFSAKLASPRTGTPERAQLQIRLDDANGYIIGVIAQTAEAEIQREINAAAYSAYANAALGGLAEVRSGLRDAARGARRLADGAGDAHTGARQLATGAKRLNDGAARLEDGSAQVRDGVEELRGVVDAAGAVVGDAAAGAGRTLPQLTADARGVAERAERRARTARARVRTAARQLDALGAAAPDVASTGAYRSLAAALDDLQAAADEAADAATRARARLTAVSRRVAAVPDDVAARVRRGVRQVDRLADGAAQVADGAAELHDGTRQARSGALRLSDGTAQLEDGADELASKLGSAVRRIPSSDAQERSRQADVVSNPVALRTSNAHPAVEYGRGLAPFFLSIALWVFGLVAYLMLRPVSGPALASRLPAHVVALGAWLPAFGLGLIGATVLYLVVDVGLGLDPESVPGTLGLAFLAVAAFTALLHLLRLAFGAVGDAVALLLLVLQLAATGGIYPIETAPAPLQLLHPVLPMTYLIDAFRITISGGETGRLAVDVAVLLGLLGVLLALSTLVVRRQRAWTMARLKPQLEL